MILRPARTEDKSAITNLLKSSLGDSLIPKSKELWEWKHEQNPFGSSFVLLAEENDEIIGVRAFMQWRWIWKDKIFHAIRAVDTATHPAHQGKGIFKKLTLKQLELCEQQGIDFVFNTPNDQSRPGYLKMGWQQQGKLPLKLSIATPFSLASQVIFKKLPASEKELNGNAKDEWQNVLNLLKYNKTIAIPGLHTDINELYVSWRYAINPLYNYGFITDHKNYVLLYRIKEHKLYRELRITDFILFNDDSFIKADIKKQLKRAIKLNNANIISISGNQYQHFHRYFNWMGIIPVNPWGPIVTVRKVNNQIDITQLLDSSNWQYSLGDLELF